MKIMYLGTGAAEGFPAMFCSCPFCQNAKKIGKSEYRTRTQILIDDILSIDFPPEAYSHSLEYNINLSRLKYLLVTHSHMDHFYAHDFILRGYKYAQMEEDVLDIYGNKEVNKVFAECTAREMKPEVEPHVQMHEISPYNIFSLGDYKVITIPAQHSKTEDALLFYVENNGKGYLHLHDTGNINDCDLKYLADNGARANLVSFDCTFVDNSYGSSARHMGIDGNMVMKQKLQSLGIIDDSSELVITHFSHNANPTRERLAKIEREYNVIAAYDGMTIEIWYARNKAFYNHNKAPS